VKATSRKPTVKDVAKAAGVSPMTVSNVINASGRVSSDTAIRVRQVIEELGYRQSTAARRFRLSKQWMIGLLVVDDNLSFLGDPFTTEVITGLTNYLTGIGYSLTLRGIRPSQFDTHDLFHGIETDAMVLLLSGSSEERLRQLKSLQSFKVPIVLIQEPVPPLVTSVACIRQDDFGGGSAIALHLCATGARDFWMLVPRAVWPAFEARRAGFENAMSAVPGARLRVLDCEDERYETIVAVVSEALGHSRPEAIVGLNDQMAIAAMHAAQRLGLSVPDELQVTGFNGLAFWQFSTPHLTTVLSQGHEIGYRAGAELIAALGSGRFKQKDVVLPVSLRLAESTRHMG